MFTEGDFTLLAVVGRQMCVYLRRMEVEEQRIAGNFSGREADYPLPEGWGDVPLLLANYPDASEGAFRPWEARMLYRTKEDC